MRLLVAMVILNIKKKNPTEIKDCFEKLIERIFAFNQALDGIIYKTSRKWI